MRNKKFFRILFASLPCLFVIACDNLANMQLPESVSVKTSATYKLPLGTASYDVSEVLGEDAIVEKMRETLGSEADVYSYVPDASSDVMQYLIHKSLVNIPLDMGEYLSNLNIDEMLGNTGSGINFSQQIALPKVETSSSLSFDASGLASSFAESTNAVLGGAAFEITGLGTHGREVYTEELAGSKASVTVSNRYAGGLAYTSGSALLINVSRTDSNTLESGTSFKFSATIDEISTGSYIYGGSSSGVKDVTDGGQLVLPLDNGELPSSFSVKLDVAWKNPSAPGVNDHTYRISFAMKSGSGYKWLYDIDTTGGTADPSDDISIPQIEVPEMSFDLSAMGSLLKSATIGEGSLNIKARSPQNWSGVSIDWDEFTMSGAGFNLNKNDFTDNGVSGYLINKTLNLAGKTMIPTESDSSVSVSGKLSINLDHASLYLGENGSSNTSISTDVDFGIKSISSAVADLSSLGGFDMGSMTIPEELIQFVKKITFGQESGGKYYKSLASGDISSTLAKGMGIKGKFVNSMPAGNDFVLKIHSDVFGLDIDGNLSGNGTTAARTANWVDYPVIDFTGKAAGDPMDLSISLPQNAALSNLEMGKSYTIGLSDLEFVMDWDTIELSLASTASFTGEMDLSSLDINAMLENLGDNFRDIIDQLEIESLPVYFYARRPDGALADLVGSIGIDGKVMLEYTEASTQKSEYLLGSSSANETVNFVQSVSWPQTTVYSSRLNASDASFHKDLAPIINARPTGLKVSYDMGLSGGSNATLCKAMLDQLSSDSATNIAIDMAVVLPLKINIKNDVTVDVMEMVSASQDGAASSSGPKDMLSREDPSSTAQFASYVNSIKYMKLRYNFNNKIVPNLKLRVKIDDTDAVHPSDASDYSGFYKEVNLMADREISITGTDMENILTKYFNPKIEIVLQQGEIAVSRSGLKAGKDGLGVGLIFEMKMDENSPISITEIMNSSSGNE